MVTLSPVKRDSLTSTLPSTIMQSATICLPLDKQTISSITTSAVVTSYSLPPRITFAVGAVSKLSFSMVRFALISCTIPMVVFASAITINTRFLYECAINKLIAMARHSILKKVNILFKKIDR